MVTATVVLSEPYLSLSLEPFTSVKLCSQALVRDAYSFARTIPTATPLHLLGLEVSPLSEPGMSASRVHVAGSDPAEGHPLSSAANTGADGQAAAL